MLRIFRKTVTEKLNTSDIYTDTDLEEDLEKSKVDFYIEFENDNEGRLKYKVFNIRRDNGILMIKYTKSKHGKYVLDSSETVYDIDYDQSIIASIHASKIINGAVKVHYGGNSLLKSNMNELLS